MPWLDAARYADTHGYHIDSLREMWPWRDWVIDAFNRNMPFDQFAIEQLAGDLLPERHARAEDRLRLQPQPHDQLRRRRDRRGVPGRVRRRPRRGHVERVHGPDDGLRALPRHKFDPITQKEFYQFFAFFNTVPEQGLDGRTGNAAPFCSCRRPSSRRGSTSSNAAIETQEAALADAVVAPLQARVGSDGRGADAAADRRRRPGRALRARRQLLRHLGPLSARPHGRAAIRPSTPDRSAGRPSFDGDTEVSFGNVGAFDRADAVQPGGAG